MIHLLGDIVKYFSFDEINIENWVFKLFYKGCFILFLMGSMVGILSQYFGEPINCDFKGIDSEMASDYCWIHGSTYIPPQYQKHLKCRVELEKPDGQMVTDEDDPDLPRTQYYQWVTFVMMVQAGAFMLPYKIWSALEGGLLADFGIDAKSGILLKDDDDGNGQAHLIEKYVKYFKSILHRNNYYFLKYLCCEFLNLVMLYLNFYMTDVFLNGNFWYYGWDAVKFNQLSYKEQQSGAVINPMCKAFPTEVSCSLPNVGAAGGEQIHNGICVLSQNIINEKMYLAIWFWLVILIIISPLCIFYRIMTLFFDGFRTALLMARVGNTNDKTTRKSIKAVMARCYLGDWFVLYQISKNVNMYFFRAFMRELKFELVPSRKASFNGNSLSRKNKLDTLSRNSRTQSPPLMDQLPELPGDDDENSDVENGKSNSPTAPMM